MLPEALVIFACLNNTGCSETSSHYYNTHPQIQEVVRKGEKIARRYVGPVVIETVGPFVVLAAGGTGNIRLHKYFSLQISQKNTILGFTKEF